MHVIVFYLLRNPSSYYLFTVYPAYALNFEMLFNYLIKYLLIMYSEFSSIAVGRPADVPSILNYLIYISMFNISFVVMFDAFVE